MPITNRDRFPDVDFLPDSQIKAIGDVGGVTLVLVGTEQGTDAAVVSRAYTDKPATEDLFAVPLYALLSQTQDLVNLPGLD